MAQALWNEASLKLAFLNGMKENGDPNLVIKTFRNLNETATPEQIYAAAQRTDIISDLFFIFS